MIKHFQGLGPELTWSKGPHVSLPNLRKKSKVKNLVNIRLMEIIIINNKISGKTKTKNIKNQIYIISD